MTNDRYEFIDIAKGVGILAVVWAHILLVGWTHEIIYAFHMPLFFFISGFLFNVNKYSSFQTFLVKRFKRLIITYFIYSFVTWGIWFIFRYVRHDLVKSYWMPLLQTFIAQGSGSYLVHNSALWFIPCLLAVEIMFFFISRLSEGLKISVCFVMALVGVLLAHSLGDAYLFNMPWNLDVALLALPFYGTGNILRKRIKLLDIIITHKALFLGISVILLFLLGYLSFNFGECSMGSSSYQCNEIIFLIRAFTGIFLLLSVCLILTKNNFMDNYIISKIIDSLKWCGQNSLDIMCMHIPIKGVIIILVSRILSPAIEISESFLFSLLIFAITIFINIVLILLLNKFKNRIKYIY